jgi:hypothetical protein
LNSVLHIDFNGFLAPFFFRAQEKLRKMMSHNYFSRLVCLGTFLAAILIYGGLHHFYKSGVQGEKPKIKKLHYHTKEKLFNLYGLL